MTFVFLFDDDKTPSSEYLGNKGANLAVMKQMGLPVPEGYTVTTNAFHTCMNNRENLDNRFDLPAELRAEIRSALEKIEQRTGKTFGDPERPLFLSVRSGASVSMPGMLDTILNLGLSDRTVPGLAGQLGSLPIAYHTYCRFIQMYASVVLGIDRKQLMGKEAAVSKTAETERTAKEWQEEIDRLKKAVQNATPSHEPFPEEPLEQLERAVLAVFDSWNNPRAVTYRRVYGISPELGTAVTVQAMVFGNSSTDSGTGVMFTRDPSTGNKRPYGEFLPQAQGEDLVGGRRTPESLSFLQRVMPNVYRELLAHGTRLEAHFRDMQDIEFTVEKGKLYLLQTRTGKRTTQAAVKIAVNLYQEGLLDQKEAWQRVNREEWERLLIWQLDPNGNVTALAKGIGATPGTVSGPIALDAKRAILQRELGQPAIFIRRETDPDDFPGIEAAVGVLTAQGGTTSHAAVVTRPMGKPCVVGCRDIVFDLTAKTVRIGNQTLAEGEWLTIDGTSGEVVQGRAPLFAVVQSPEVATFLEWSKKFDHKSIDVRSK